MTELTYTLLSDGSSDRRLMPIITWLLHKHCPNLAIQSEWADFRQMRNPPQTLSGRIRRSIEIYPCDLLFIHRDAEDQSLNVREGEIEQAVIEATQYIERPTFICVIPVRMQEAWLLFDETALRRAAGNPRGRTLLSLPNLSSIEYLPNPKVMLYELLKNASELTGRRLRRFKASRKAHLIAEYIRDFSPLRTLPAFQVLESELIDFLTRAKVQN